LEAFGGVSACVERPYSYRSLLFFFWPSRMLAINSFQPLATTSNGRHVHGGSQRTASTSSSFSQRDEDDRRPSSRKQSVSSGLAQQRAGESNDEVVIDAEQAQHGVNGRTTTATAGVRTVSLGLGGMFVEGAGGTGGGRGGAASGGRGRGRGRGRGAKHR
jgi:hypothetical protein